jgi:hypothetical protein
MSEQTTTALKNDEEIRATNQLIRYYKTRPQDELIGILIEMMYTYRKDDMMRVFRANILSQY